MLRKKALSLLLSVSFLTLIFSGCIGENVVNGNSSPIVVLDYPLNQRSVLNIVTICGSAMDPDGNQTLSKVEVSIDDEPWIVASGTTLWSYSWNTFGLEDERMYNISVRAVDDNGKYSDEISVCVYLDNPDVVESGTSKFAVFVATGNFPENDEEKLGNGGLVLAERMAKYLIEDCGYPTSNIFILFDDGWLRADNGYGEPISTLQMRPHEYDVTYGAATAAMVDDVIDYVVDQSNMDPDSEVFLWMFNHGYGNLDDPMFGGKMLESSMLFLWDDLLSDEELGEKLSTLKSKKTTIIVDACFSGGFADKTIYGIPTSILMKSGVPRIGRVVMTGASKYRPGYASTTQGPLFSLLWFEGLTTGDADGFRPGLLNMGRQTISDRKKDGVVSVEEAFYYACWHLRNDEILEDYDGMEPQITDRYPGFGFLFNTDGLILG